MVNLQDYALRRLLLQTENQLKWLQHRDPSMFMALGPVAAIKIR